MNLVISAIGVLLFAGLTAYDTQRIKSMYFAVAGHGEAMAKSAVMGALQLYLDFINMFLFLLRFMGDRRSSGRPGETCSKGKGRRSDPAALSIVGNPGPAFGFNWKKAGPVLCKHRGVRLGARTV